MRFNSVRTSDYSQSAKAVNKASDQIFDAAVSGKPDFTKISKEAIKGRALERRTATEAEGTVAQAGLDAIRKTKLTRMKADTAKEVSDIKRPAKRMAGIVAGLGSIAGAAVLLKEDKEEKADTSAYLQMLQSGIDRSTTKAQQYRDEASGLNTDLPKPVPAPSISSSNSTDDTSTSQPKISATNKTSTSQPKLSANNKTSAGFNDILQMATNAGAKYPQLVAAQWALESGWGKTPSGKNNFFGIKASPGESSTSKQTWEVIDGKEITTSANFKNYDSPQGSVNDLVSRWHQNYKSYTGVNNASDAYAAADMLRQQGYATDPAYAEKLKKIMKDQGY